MRNKSKQKPRIPNGFKNNTSCRQTRIPSNIGKDIFCWGIRNDFIDWEDKDFGFNIKQLKLFFRHIKPALDNYSAMTWVELQKRKSCHPMDTSKIVHKAITRLKELFPEEDNTPETLYQIDMPGLGQKYRIWGRKENNVFYLLWNDPEHKIYPVSKKHT